MTAPDAVPQPLAEAEPPNHLGRWAYDRETAIERSGPGRWTTTLHRHWNINDNPNGGYALSPLLAAMAAEVSGHPDPLTVTTHFLRPALAEAGADLGVEVIRRGRRTSTVRASMTQGQKVRLESMATFGELGLGQPTDPGLDIDPPDLPAPDDCVDRSRLAQGVEPALLSRIDARIDPALAPVMSSPGHSPETSTANSTEEPTADQRIPTANAADATIAGWMRFHDGRPVDSRALVLFADCFPPSVFSAIGRTGWVPTIELTVHVRRRPVPGWIRARFTTRDLAGDLLIEDGLLWDETGQVVAQSRQLALLAL